MLPLGCTPPSSEHEDVLIRSPVIYKNNVPKYSAVHRRTRDHAQQNDKRIAWTTCIDIPLFQDDRCLPVEKLDEKRRRWLERHDQSTTHLTSILPLAEGLSLRLTDTLGHKRRLYRGRRGFILGWAPHPEETQLELGCESVLGHLPTAIYVYFEGATWTIHDDLGIGVYPVTLNSRTWKVNKYTGVQARRTGYCLLPDFASAAHMLQGPKI